MSKHKPSNIAKAFLAAESAALLLAPVVADTKQVLPDSVDTKPAIHQYDDAFRTTVDRLVRQGQSTAEDVLEQYKKLYTSEAARASLELPYEVFESLSESRRKLVVALAENNVLPYLRDANGKHLNEQDLGDLEVVFELKERTPAFDSYAVLLKADVVVTEDTLKLENLADLPTVSVTRLTRFGVSYTLPQVGDGLRSDETGADVRAHSGIYVEEDRYHTRVIVGKGSDDYYRRELAQSFFAPVHEQLEDPIAYLNQLNRSGNVFPDSEALQRFAEGSYRHRDIEGIILPRATYALEISYGDRESTAVVVTNTNTNERIVIHSRYINTWDAQRLADASAIVLAETGGSDSNVYIRRFDETGVSSAFPELHGYTHTDERAASEVDIFHEMYDRYPAIRALNISGFNLKQPESPLLINKALQAFSRGENGTNYSFGSEADYVRFPSDSYEFRSGNGTFDLTREVDGEEVKLTYILELDRDIDTNEIYSVEVYRGKLIFRNPSNDYVGRETFFTTVLTAGNEVYAATIPEGY